MLKYELVEENDLKVLNDVVNLALAEGWTLYGSPSVACCTDTESLGTYMYAQAMTQEEPN